MDKLRQALRHKNNHNKRMTRSGNHLQLKVTIEYTVKSSSNISNIALLLTESYVFRNVDSSFRSVLVFVNLWTGSPVKTFKKLSF